MDDLLEELPVFLLYILKLTTKGAIEDKEGRIRDSLHRVLLTALALRLARTEIFRKIRKIKRFKLGHLSEEYETLHKTLKKVYKDTKTKNGSVKIKERVKKSLGF